MKNKKIILGLGTITALGAMSMGFVACGVKKEVTDGLDKKITSQDEEIKFLRKVLGKVSGEDKVFKAEVDAFFEKTGTGNTAKDPKAVGELKKDAKVSDLIAKVKEMPGFANKFDIISKDSDKDGTTADGQKLSGTTHTLTITKNGEDKINTTLKEEITFTFTLKKS